MKNAKRKPTHKQILAELMKKPRVHPAIKEKHDDIEDAIAEEGGARGGLRRTLAARITPEWCVNMAKMEEGHEVGAGVAGLDPTSDCPHAAPFRYCETCKVSPCPIGLGGQR